MATTTANGLNVLGGTIHAPVVGAWTAELDVDGIDASKVAKAVSLVLGDATWKGQALESGVYVGRVKVRMVGGAGGLSKPTKAHFYHAIPARTVVSDLLSEGGETLSPTSNAAKLGTILPFWTRPAGTVSEGLENVLDEIGATWRVLPDGTIWVGANSWPKATVANVVVESESPHDSQIVFSSDTPSLTPGTTFRDQKVSSVEHVISPGKTRTTARYGDGDALSSSLDSIVRKSTKHLDYFATRSGKVASQNTDGTLELRLDDDDMPGMSKIPIAYGVPGISAKVKPGAKVHVQWANGSPTKPRAIVIDSAEIIELSIQSEMVKVSGAADFVALAAKVDARFDALEQWAVAHIHPTGVGPSGPGTPPATPGHSVACTKLKTD